MTPTTHRERERQARLAVLDHRRKMVKINSQGAALAASIAGATAHPKPADGLNFAWGYLTQAIRNGAGIAELRATERGLTDGLDVPEAQIAQARR